MIKIDNKIKNEYRNKNILITGGTGSIGIALVKKLIGCKPKVIKILTNDENSIFDVLSYFFLYSIVYCCIKLFNFDIRTWCSIFSRRGIFI